jgi:PTS system galactitol-specific IIA component
MGREGTGWFEGVLFRETLVLPDLEVPDAPGVMRSLTACLQSEGCIRDGFLDALLARERDYPTGLATKTMAVAIPHADPTYVEVPALAAARLRHPVSFRAMDDPGRPLDVRLVFLIALKSPKDQIAFLKKFAQAIQSGEFLGRLVSCADRSCLYREIGEALGVGAREDQAAVGAG